MSSQRGNDIRSRPQKHKNTKAFSNTLHNSTSQRTKQILKVSPSGLCARCKDKIEWRIKYKKYKPLTQPATCTKCQQKTVKKAYHIVCQPCAVEAGICSKCLEKTEIVIPIQADLKQTGQFEQELRMLTERQRRSFFRLQAQGKLTDLEAFTDSKTDCDKSDEGENDDQDFDGNETRIGFNFEDSNDNR